MATQGRNLYEGGLEQPTFMISPLVRHAARLGLACATLAGCSLGPRYERPALDVPAAFRATSASAAAAWPAPDWWRGFGSPELDALIAAARAYNQDLAAAVARVREADAQLRIAGSALLPTVFATGDGSYQRTRNLDARRASLEAQVSYEVDLWGRLRALRDAAAGTALANRFDQETVALTVVTSVASTYFQALAYQDRLRVAERNLRDAGQILQAYRARLEVGTASALDVSQQQAQVEGIRASIPSLQSGFQQQAIALGILTGRPPERITIRGGSLDELRIPVPAAGLPAEVLARRPDVAYAEANLLSQNGNVRAARAAFFPTVQLTGAGGWSSLAFSTLFGPGSSLVSLAGSVTQTIFDNGQLSGQLAFERARSDELVAAYRKAVLQAFTDVETELVALRYATEQEALERQATATAQRSADIARAQLQAGTSDIITSLTVQNTLYNDLDQLVQVRLTRFQALVNLYKALGGGWTLSGGST